MKHEINSVVSVTKTASQ